MRDSRRLSHLQPEFAPAPPASRPMTRRRKLEESKPPPEDRLGALPDDILGEIVSLLPTKDGARTQALASQWRRIWRSSPLNIDYRDLTGANKNVRRRKVAEAISSILSAHTGPGRRLCVKRYNLSFPCPPQDAWLDSAALNGLQEIEFWFVKYSYHFNQPYLPPPPSIYRFSASLRVATFGRCLIPDDVVQGLNFPNLKQLALEYIRISEPSLESLIARCPVLEGLLIHSSFGFRQLRIVSVTLRSICVRVQGLSAAGELQFQELILENAPCLEKLITLRVVRGLRVSVIYAPKLDTLGFLTNLYNLSTTIVFPSTVIQGLGVDILAMAVHTVKVLAVNMDALSIDNIVGFMRFFPCLEKLHVKTSPSSETNLWRRKHKDLIECLDLRLKTVVLDWYIGTCSHINFANFFVLNARMLELMRFHVDAKVWNEKFLADQHRKLQLKDKVSKGAQFDFTTNKCPKDVWNAKHLRDLDLYDPFACHC
ncbi:unnamed protein product [Alopecurus aequalis]